MAGTSGRYGERFAAATPIATSWPLCTYWIEADTDYIEAALGRADAVEVWT